MILATLAKEVKKNLFNIFFALQKFALKEKLELKCHD